MIKQIIAFYSICEISEMDKRKLPAVKMDFLSTSLAVNAIGNDDDCHKQKVQVGNEKFSIC